MPRYSREFKETIVQKMMPPNAQSIAQIHRDTGVSEPTLYNWRNQYKNKGKAVPADPSNPENWSAQDKLAVVIETASLNEQALSEYCRKVTTHPYQHRAVPKRPFEWRPADCIPDLPWSAGNWRCGNR
ncbi:transposase, partial [Thiolapillus sp.]